MNTVGFYQGNEQGQAPGARRSPTCRHTPPTAACGHGVPAACHRAPTAQATVLLAWARGLRMLECE
eukprot:353404-Chlamydomonas_euryale.AAC.14